MPHNSNKRPSTLGRHQKGQTDAKNGKENSRWKAYKAAGGKLSKDTWKKSGMPSR
ncbi:MAG: hypothetical protein WBF90_35045 [Rivularia sp. (in: cyanobacteria)]